MSRSVITAVMLEDLHRTGAEIRLTKNALVTPAARDWMKEHPVPVIWEDGEKSGCSLAVVMDPTLPEMRAMRTMLDNIGGLAEVIEPVSGRDGLASATGQLCEKIARQEVGKGVVFTQEGAMPVCIANKHKGIRAALGMNVPVVEEACRELGINVLVIEYPVLTTYLMKQMIDRFCKGSTAGRPETAAAIEKIERAGDHANR